MKRKNYPLRKMNLIYILCILLSSVQISTNAQSIERQVIGSTGTFTTVPSISLSTTVGETVTSSSITPSIHLTQGFQQAEQGGVTNITPVKYASLSIKAWPNPTQSLINVHVTNSDIGFYKVKIMDMAGKEVMHFDNQPSKFTVDLSSLSTGSYLLELVDSKGTSKGTFKINRII